MKKLLAAVITSATCAVALTGCSYQTTPEHPAEGRWVTAIDDASGKAVGDVWCIDSSLTKSRGLDCQWPSLTDPRTHADAEEVAGEWRYVVASDQRERKIFCIHYSLRRNAHVTSCNWNAA